MDDYQLLKEENECLTNLVKHYEIRIQQLEQEIKEYLEIINDKNQSSAR